MNILKKPLRIALSIVLLAVLAVGLRICEKSNMPHDLETLIARLNTNVDIYGKVIDQYGKPVAGATVALSPINRFQGSYGGIKLTTDSAGLFLAKGLYGKSLGIAVNKEGYLRYPPLSSISSSELLNYERSDAGERHSNASNPIMLELLKLGLLEPLAYVKKKRWKLSVDGTPRTISLETEKGEGAHQIEFRFKSDWDKLPANNEINSKMYDWSFEIRISGGGLVWDESDAKFEAPDYGYKETIRYTYFAGMPREDWKRMRYGRYFVKFADGTHGRIQFDIDGSSDRSPLYMESWLNLKPDSRNLATKYMVINTMETKEPEN